jgi:hypothetical protein
VEPSVRNAIIDEWQFERAAVNSQRNLLLKQAFSFRSSGIKFSN